jgi:DNA topoisomerase I
MIEQVFVCASACFSCQLGQVMTASERQQITDFKKCDFSHIADHFDSERERKKTMTKEEKQVRPVFCCTGLFHNPHGQRIKEENEKIVEEFGFCTMDGRREKIGNFRIEPPGLFRGRGEHPKMGRLKRRIQPEDVIVNCSADAKPPSPPAVRRPGKNMC